MELIEKCKDFKDDYDNRKATYEKYNLQFREQRGALYEEDGYTKLIENALSYIKAPQQEKDKRKPILIIEDLDRVDPAHLFRILNVLGAHIDADKQTNKFGFENIVVVMDYDATEHIFHHFYGEKANYSGYISKFMSHYPFRYSLKLLAEEYFYRYFEEKCLLEKEEIEEMVVSDNQTVEYVLQSKSIRDIVQVIDDVEEQIDLTPITLRDGSMVNTNTPIVRLLILTHRMGIERSELERLLNDIRDKNIARFFQIMGDLILAVINIKFEKSHSFTYNDLMMLMTISQDGLYKHCVFANWRNNYIIPKDVVDLSSYYYPRIAFLPNDAYDLAQKHVKDIDKSAEILESINSADS